MPVIVIDKEDDSITVTTGGVAKNVTVRRVDTIVSVPPAGYKKVFNIYWNADDAKLLISVEE